MTIAKLKLLPRSTMKAKALIRLAGAVLGGDGITVTQDGVTWTVALDADTLALLADLEASVSALTGELRVVTAAGSVTVSATEGGVAINKTVGAATQVNLPAAADRDGIPVIVKDMKGDALTNNITVVPNGSEVIDGGTDDIIDFAYQTRTYAPIAGYGYLKIG